VHLTRRALAVSAMALSALATASGCTATNAQQTAEPYSPGAAAATTVGAVHVAGLFVATDGEGPAALVARIVNSGDGAASVEIADEGGSGLRGSFTVEPATTLEVGPGGEQVRVPDLEATPGQVLQMSVSTGDSSTTLAVPVLDGTLEPYAAYVPTATPTASPTASVTSSPTATGTRTGSPTGSPSPSATSSASRTPSPGASTTAAEDEG